ncbi:MAG: hypothetical protein M3443_13285 [Actinomycetota bacterium]|nr:hypothetical protein [Actinomycetota bacterium]
MWWPDAATVQLLRVTDDGTIMPVRGAYPLIPGQTRRNYCVNPGAEAGINGWAPGAGAPVVTRISTVGDTAGSRRNLVTKPSAEDAGAVWGTYGAGTTVTRVQPSTMALVRAGTWANQAVCATAATNFGAAHTITSGIVPGEYYTASAYMQPQVTRDIRVILEWRDAAGVSLTTNSGTTTAVTPSVWTRVSLNRIAPPDAARVVISMVALAGAIGETLLVDAAMLEQTSSGAAPTPYFDGSTPGGTWDGAIGVSSSRMTVVDAVPAGHYALRLITTGTAASEVTVPTASVPESSAVTVAMDLRTSSTPTGAVVTLSWTNTSGALLGSTTATLSIDQLVFSSGQWTRQRVAVLAPPGAANMTVARLQVTGLPAGATVDVDQVVVERGVVDGTPLDGDMLAGTWIGIAHLSVSVLADMVDVVDGECPLDRPVRYVLANPAVTGGRMTSETVTLDSLGQAWLTHPAAHSEPVRVAVRGRGPALTRVADRGVFAPIGRRRPVVVTAPARKSLVGELDLITLTFADRDRLLSLFDDMAPVLLRSPASLGYPEAMWLSLGDLDETGGERPSSGFRVLSSPFVEVDAPWPETG